MTPGRSDLEAGSEQSWSAFGNWTTGTDARALFVTLVCVTGAALSQKVRYRFRARRSMFAGSGADFVAGAVLSQGRVQISWQTQHFSGRRNALDFVAGAALSQGQAQTAWQAQHFGKVRYRFRGRRSTFARSGSDFLAGAPLFARCDRWVQPR